MVIFNRKYIFLLILLSLFSSVNFARGKADKDTNPQNSIGTTEETEESALINNEQTVIAADSQTIQKTDPIILDETNGKDTDSEENQESAYEVPVFTPSSENIPRYQKEYLQDYAPVKIENQTYVNITEDVSIADPNETDEENGLTLLMNAAKNSDLPFLKLLLKSGADVNLKDKDGWTALMYGIRYQTNLQIVQELINKGANVKTESSYGVTPLYLAALYNDNPQILNVVLKKYQLQEKEIQKAFVHMIMDNSTKEDVKLEKVKIFLQNGMRINIFYNGKTPLMYACQYGNSTKIIKYLMDSKADKKLRSTEGMTAFEYAALNLNLAHDDIYWELNGK